MGMVGDLSKYTQYQVATSIPLAAQNEGGVAGVGAGLGAGVAMGQAMFDSMRNTQVGNHTPVETMTTETYETRLEKLKGLLDKGLITQGDYDTTKAEILKKIIG